MTSHSHQNYTRKWAVQANCPILSVDYRLAPDAPYPAALDDVWQTYMWLRNSSAETLGLKPGKIVIAGDSAGGNLAMGLVMKAIETKQQLPDGLLLPYPALNLSLARFTPSSLLSLDDLVLHHTFLKLCLKSYISDSADPKSDPYLSPILIPDEILRQFPPVRLIVGGKDPLHDDCWRLAERLQRLGVNMKMSVFEGFIHGALNYAVVNGIEEADRMVQQGSEYLLELFNS